jgi:hypothetical protein
VDVDLDVRGFKYGVINVGCDRLSGSVRGHIVGKLVDESGNGVGSHWQRIYCEAPALAGAVLQGQCAQLRVESGYTGQDAIYHDFPIGAFPLPDDIEWEYFQANKTIKFTFPGGWAHDDCRHYFEPRMPYRFAPTNQAEPPRWLYVTGVSQYELTFADPDSKSFISVTSPREFSGIGAGVLRCFGTGVVLDGDQASVIDPSTGCNEAHSNLPAIFIRPDSKPIKVGGHDFGRGINSGNISDLPVIVASSVGTQFTLQGGADFLGSADVPDHPLANPGGIGPRFDANIREPQWDPQAEKLRFRPGRGVSYQNLLSYLLTFHYWGDPEGYLGYVSAQGTINDASPQIDGFAIAGTYAASSGVYYAGRSLLFKDNSSLPGLVANVLSYDDAGGGVPYLAVHGLPAVPVNGDEFFVLGAPTPCYRLGDGGTSGWELRHLRRAGVETWYTIRAYVPSGTPTLTVSGGGVGNNTHALAAGWQTISGRLTATQVVADIRGPFMRLTQTSGDIYVAWVEVSLSPPVESGVYVPTVAPGLNVNDADAYECQYLRVGNTVTVSGNVDITPLNANAATSLRLSLPVSSNFGALEDCAGTANGTAYAVVQAIVSGLIQADTTNNEASLFFYTPGTAVDMNMRFHFTYQVIDQ